MKRHSTVLNQMIEIIDGNVICSDGVEYSSEELASLKGLSSEEKKVIHGLKLNFQGSLI